MAQLLTTYFNDRYWIACRVVFLYTWFVRIKYLLTYCFIVLIATLQTIRLLDGTSVLFLGTFMALLVQIESELSVGAVLADNVRIKSLCERVATTGLSYRSYTEILTQLSALVADPPPLVAAWFRGRFKRVAVRLSRETMEALVAE